MQEVYESILDDLEMGLIDCTDTDCDCCIHEPITFDDLHALEGGERLT